MPPKKKIRISPNARRTLEQKQADGIEMVRLLGEGKTQQQIADLLSKGRSYKVSRKMVSNDLREIIAAWKTELIERLNQIRFQETAKLNRMEAELWKDYEASGGEVQTTRQRQSESSRGVTKEAEVLTRRRVRNPLIMLTILQVCERRSKLLGLDAPTKIANADGGPIDVPGGSNVDVNVAICTEFGTPMS